PRQDLFHPVHQADAADHPNCSSRNRTLPCLGTGARSRADGLNTARTDRVRFYVRVVFSGINKQVLFKAVLLIIKLLVTAALSDKLLVRSPLDDLAALNHKYLIGTPNGRQPVGDNKGRAAAPQAI